MGKIRLLDRDTIGKIAAGEVVEGSASVVKELVENAIDAESRRISIILEDGGRRRVTVIDDGCGIDPADVELAFQRHATSKIADASELRAVKTLGFRGEALPVLAAVSRLTLITRPAERASGTEIRLEGGQVIGLREVGCPQGTRVVVEDLFFNVPPRRLSLRSARAEAARAAEVAGCLALARPEVAIRLISGDREVLASPGSGRRLDTVAAVLGSAEASRLLEVCSPPITGYLGPPDLHASHRSALTIVVNGRPVRDRAVAGAVEEAYRTVLPPGRFPVGTLWLELPPEEVDVNVHPAKLTVAHRDPQAVRRLVRSAMEAALARAAPARPLWPERPEVADPAGAAYGAGAEQPAMWGQTAGSDIRRPWDFRVIGQIHRKYVVLEAPDGVYLMDQHAAHERIAYERLADGDPSNGTQLLLIPPILELRPGERAGGDEFRQLLEETGFILEPFGGNALLVRGVPAGVADVASADFLRTVLARLGDGGGTDIDRLRRLLAACRAALKAGKDLSREEMEALTRELGATRRPATCAHGRPTLLRIGSDELERRFGRS
ncbi:MAG TPA: DNA mismatch repair endonuclease MutL [Clostridiales bacterium]|nr:DNA mismatch repair endonuclease MutL [Clostridiales bacterium]